MQIKDLFKELLAICILTPMLYNFCSADVQLYQDFYVNMICDNWLCSVEFPWTSPWFIALWTWQSTFNCEINNEDTSFNISDINWNIVIWLENNFWQWVSIYEFELENINRRYQWQFEFNNETYIDIWSVPNSYYANYFTFFSEFQTSENIEGWSLFLICSWVWNVFSTIQNNNQQECTWNIMTSLECQSEYSLIPISSVDSTYCESNNLCSSSWWGECEPWDSNWSALYINDIQHLWKPIISIDIPEEIDRDYLSTDSQFNVDIIGYNVDYEKINTLVDLQSYKPSSDDFTKLISDNLPLILKYLLIVLFLFFVYKGIKKPFSSKKF